MTVSVLRVDGRHRVDPPVHPTALQTMIASVQQLVPFKAWRLGKVQGKTLAWFRFGPDGDERAEIKRFFACYRSQLRRLDPRMIATIHDSAIRTP